eukprot:3633150-Rhodomonas_salina.2
MRKRVCREACKALPPALVTTTVGALVLVQAPGVFPLTDVVRFQSDAIGLRESPGLSKEHHPAPCLATTLRQTRKALEEMWGGISYAHPLDSFIRKLRRSVAGMISFTGNNLAWRGITFAVYKYSSKSFGLVDIKTHFRVDQHRRWGSTDDLKPRCTRGSGTLAGHIWTSRHVQTCTSIRAMTHPSVQTFFADMETEP